ncbi:laccase [Lentinula guzmanii]|uniref:Laccase n=1 Tax=Lentinula guzmanii TaxID=2804957 RepID=A0AA38MVK8_9AGAR|nr:laccase [Lentinula guzmanii]KAJ3793820.1 laccase [Lentinula aff. detonsa]
MFFPSIILGIFLLGLSSNLVQGVQVVNPHPRNETWHRNTVHHDQLYIVNKDIAPDGFLRSTVLAGRTPYNASLPGTLITGRKGDRFLINVTDSLMDPTMDRSTSVHWHGLFQKTTNYADGVAFVSQCPIAANHSFLYDFGIPDQAGTFWYHSHLSVQYGDGLRGPIVIYDPEDPHQDLYDVDDESTVITIADWFHLTSLQLLAALVVPSADATLINGKGRYAGGPNTPLAVIQVEHGKRYRFRLIDMSFDAFHAFSIDNHNLTIIEVDGINTVPHTVNFMELYPAQRYSAILHANQVISNYRIRALPNTGVGAHNFTNGVNSAILRYIGAPDEDPTTSQPPSSEVVVFREGDLHPLENPGAPGEPYPGGADLVLNLTLGFDPDKVLFSMNGVVFEPPTVPVLLQILSGAQHAQDLLPKGGVYTLPPNKVIEINLFGGDAPAGPHPFHLHGHAFDVVRTSDSPEYNFKNPVRRDTTLVALNNQTTIRFFTDNAGPWFLHCHIDLHLSLGLAVVLAEDTRDTKKDDPVPAEWRALCHIYDDLAPSQLP